MQISGPWPASTNSQESGATASPLAVRDEKVFARKHELQRKTQINIRTVTKRSAGQIHRRPTVEETFHSFLFSCWLLARLEHERKIQDNLHLKLVKSQVTTNPFSEV